MSASGAGRFTVIPLNAAAAAAGMTRDALKAALGPGRVVIVNPTKLGVRPADLEAVAPGASQGLEVINPDTDQRGQDSWPW
jgi:hypothetical protein